MLYVEDILRQYNPLPKNGYVKPRTYILKYIVTLVVMDISL